jgi:hypothetical protein
MARPRVAIIHAIIASVHTTNTAAGVRILGGI